MFLCDFNQFLIYFEDAICNCLPALLQFQAVHFGYVHQKHIHDWCKLASIPSMLVTHLSVFCYWFVIGWLVLISIYMLCLPIDLAPPLPNLPFAARGSPGLYFAKGPKCEKFSGTEGEDFSDVRGLEFCTDGSRIAWVTSKWLVLLLFGHKMIVHWITSKTPYVAIDERGLVRSIHFFLFSCVHKLNSILWTRL